MKTRGWNTKPSQLWCRFGGKERDEKAGWKLEGIYPQREVEGGSIPAQRVPQRLQSPVLHQLWARVRAPGHAGPGMLSPVLPHQPGVLILWKEFSQATQC